MFFVFMALMLSNDACASHHLYMSIISTPLALMIVHDFLPLDWKSSCITAFEVGQ